MGSGEALAKEHVRSDLRLRQNEARTQKDRLSLLQPNGYTISLTALALRLENLLVSAAGDGRCHNWFARRLALILTFSPGEKERRLGAAVIRLAVRQTQTPAL